MRRETDLQLLIATGNDGKVRELRDLFRRLPIELCGLADFRGIHVVEETGNTFLENAILKARGYAMQTGLLALADDSGLEISGLGDAPGVLSARYARENTTFAEKISMLLTELEQTGISDRSAKFSCSMSVADKAGNVLFSAEGICHGSLAQEPRGVLGFGYDPIFIPDGYDKTFGELRNDIKQQISHRARAANKLIPYLLDYIEI